MEVSEKAKIDMDEESQSVTDEEEYFKDSELVSDEVEEMFRNNRVVGFYEDEESIDELPSFSEFSIEEIEDILKDYFRFFSLEERDFIYLNLIGGKSQTDLAEIFGKTQPALCCDSNRIKEEIEVIRMMKQVRLEVIEFLSQERTGLNYMERNILLVFFYSVSITKSAYIMRINAMLCRSRIENAVNKLETLGHKKIHDYFSYILEHLNKIKATKIDEALVKSPPRKWDYTSGYVSKHLF